jgi:arginyl-tRNA synthetase
MRKADSHLDFDLTLAVQESSENPVYYVQYAHARICSILRHGEEQGIKMVDIAPDTSLLKEDEALEVIKLLSDYPEIIQGAAAALEPHRILNHMYTLAGAFHRYYKNNKVIDPDNPSLTQARLALIYAVRTVVSNGLHILGINAPEKMFKEPEE